MISLEQAKAIFAPMEEYIREREKDKVFCDMDIVVFLTSMIRSNPVIAVAYGEEVASLMNQATTEGKEVEYIDIHLQAYFNVLFDPAIAASYGTTYLLADERTLQDFVSSFINNSWALDKITMVTTFPPTLQ